MRFRCLFLLGLAISSCSDKGNTNVEVISVPSHFTLPSYPKENLPSHEKIELGKKLFFDNQLSKNNNISCATCHQPEFAFTDQKELSTGTNDSLGFRNTPSIINVAYKTIFHMDGGVRTLELQVLAPIIDTNELGGDFNQILTYLNTNSEYLKLFKSAFDTTPTIYGLTRSIASYERSLIQGNSAYDHFINGDSTALSISQKNGLALFSSERLNCTACHSGNNLTNYSFENIGLEHQLIDSGRARITYKTIDAGKFMVPSLRNVAITNPYMHNGSFSTLEEVIIYLAQGGGSHPNKSSLVKPFSLTQSERKDLTHFLEALTDSIYSLK